MPSPSNTPKSTKVKHRACDECRTRKLACSKNPEGCERCTREGLICHYSEQKPMGRPRKRQFVETLQYEQPTGADLTLQSLDMGPLPFGLTDLQDYDYDYNDGGVAQPYYTNNEATAPIVLPESLMASAEPSDANRNIWHFGDRDLVGGINFDDVNDSNHSDPILDAVPLLTTTSNDSSASDSGTSPPQNEVPRCSCLASMYLALASLQQFPLDIVQALNTVRSAARTASSTIWCKSCGSIILDQRVPAIDGFQNTMLLGTLIPIIAHGYHRLIKMVDDETDVAIANGQTKLFRFREYGGLCNIQESIQGAMICLDKELMFKDVEMPPMQWRNTVRALLRVDIYGHQQGEFNHKGLKDLVIEIENRQKARHTWLEGFHDDECHMGMFEGAKAIGEQTHACLQILEMAKVSINNLVIA